MQNTIFSPPNQFTPFNPTTQLMFSTNQSQNVPTQPFNPIQHQMNPQIQYLQPMVQNNGLFQIQPLPQFQQPQLQPMPLQFYPLQPNGLNNNNIQYVYQAPMYIQVPQMMGNMIEMQPMGPYKPNVVQSQPLLVNNNNVGNNFVGQNNNNQIITNNRTNMNNSNIPKTNNINLQHTNVNGGHILLNQQQLGTSNVSPSSPLISGDCQKRCVNCGGYYKEQHNKNGSCRYHPGQYVSSIHLSALSKWSCCKNFDKQALGCKVEKHLEDIKTSIILSQIDKYNVKENLTTSPSYPFPSTTSSLSQSNNINISQNENESTQKEGILIDIPQLFPSQSIPTNDNNSSVSKNIQKILNNQEEQKIVKDEQGYYIIDHQVQLEDTLAGLALYYSTTVNEIKLLNNLFSNDIFLKKTIKIRTKVPQDKIKPHVEETKEHKELRLTRRFILMTNAKPEEARFYLINNNWDVNLAVSDFKQDVSWEKSLKGSNVDHHIRKISRKNF